MAAQSTTDDNITRIAGIARGVSEDPRFEASDRLKALLVYLGRRASEGARVSQFDIARDVMGLGPDFDPKLDAHVRIEVGRLRKALELYNARAREGPGRITIPKGSYRPQCESPSPAAPSVSRAVSTAGPTRVFAGLIASHETPSELIEFAVSELRAHCFASPLTHTRLMEFDVQAVESLTDINRKAAETGARLGLGARIYRTDNEDRILMDVSRTDRDGVELSVRQTFPATSGVTGQARRIARGIANKLCDPILGVVPRLALTHFPARDLELVLSAYRFMDTQNTEVVPDLLEGLQELASAPHATAQIKALMAEMTRVHSWVADQDDRADPYRCLELAELAIAEDPADLTCRIALGYNRLNAGLIEAALHTGLTVLQAPAPTSLTHMARMLVSLADTEGKFRDKLTVSPFVDDTPFFMKEFAEIIPMIRWSEANEADRMLANSLFTNVFWLHVFHAAVLIEIGDKRRAIYSANRIRHQLPNCEGRLRAMIKGCFPKEIENAYLLNGLRQSGLRVA